MTGLFILTALSLATSGWASAHNSTLRSPSALYRDLVPTEAPLIDEHPQQAESAPNVAPEISESTESSPRELTELPPLPATEPLSDWARDVLLELPREKASVKPAPPISAKKTKKKTEKPTQHPSNLEGSPRD